MQWEDLDLQGLERSAKSVYCEVAGVSTVYGYKG